MWTSYFPIRRCIFFMDLSTFIFWIVAIILVGSALLVVTQSNIVQILIYTGAVAVLILFALMLTRTSNIQVRSNPNSRQWWLALIICALVGAGIIFAVTFSPHAVAN